MSAPAFLVGSLLLTHVKLIELLILLVPRRPILVAAWCEGGYTGQYAGGEGRIRCVILLIVVMLLGLRVVMMRLLVLAMGRDVVIHHLRRHGAATWDAIETRAVALLRPVHSLWVLIPIRMPAGDSLRYTGGVGDVSIRGVAWKTPRSKEVKRGRNS